MIRTAIACLLGIASAAAPPVARAQEPPAPKPAAGAAEAGRRHDELRALAATMEKALNSRDIATITSRVTNDVVFTTMNGDVVRGKDGIQKYFKTMLEGPDRVVESVTSHFVPDDLSIMLDDHTAIAFGRSDDHYELARGPSFDITARWTGTMVRREGGWDVASFHYSANVFDNPVLLAQRKLLLQTLGGGGAVVAVIAFLLGRWRRSRAAA